MTNVQKDLIKTTWSRIAQMDDKTVGALFYDRLFYIAPEVRALFLSSVPEQSKKLVAMLRYLVRHLDQPEEVHTTLSALANRHVDYKVKPYHYAIVGNALLWTLEKGLGEMWNDDTEEAWAAFYTLVSEAMISHHPVPNAVA